MFDGVEQQLVEDHHQRGGDLRRQYAERPLPAHPYRHLGRGDLGGGGGDPVDDPVELDRLVAGHGEGLVYERDRGDPAYGFLQCRLGCRYVDPAGL